MKCQAYIDPETNIALEGEALVAASKNPDAPRCGYELEPGDMFCPSCGACVEISSGGVAEASNATHNKKRTTRAAFWGAVVLFFLTNLLYFALVGENYNAMDGSLGRGIFINILGYVNLFAYGFYIKTSIRRLHDIERSGWWIAPSICFTIIATVLTIISAITESSNVVFSILDWVALIGNLGMVVWLGFAKGTKGPNKYGPDPLANDVVFGNREVEAPPKCEVPIGMSSPALNDPKLDGDAQSRSSSAAPVEPPRPRAKYRTLSFALFIVFGIASFVLQYVNRQQRTQMNAYNSEIDRHIRTALSASKAYGSLNDPSALKLLGTTEKAKLDGMFGVKFGERIPSDVAVSADATGLLMAFFEPESPDFTFDQYVKYMLPKSRVVCGIAAFFRANEKEKCREKYEQYKNEIGRRYGEMTTLRKKIGPSQFGTEEISQCIVKCEGERFINLAVEKTIDGRYQLRLIVMDSAMYQKASAEIAQAASERIPLEGLFGRKLGARAEVSVNEVRSADGSILQPFEPEERFLDFDTYCLELLPQSRTICGILAIHPCANESEASECFISAIRQLEKTFNQKMMDMTASCDTTHPDEDGEQTLRTAMLAFPRTVRIIIVQLVKNVNEGTLFVRVNALDQKLAATLQSEVLQVEESDGEEEKTETTSPHNEASALFGPIERLRRAAEQGDIDAQYNLGNKYYIGLGMDEDKDEAVKWYRKAAEQGHVSAQINLAVCYANGEGVKQDKSESVRWLRKAAEQGEAIAQLKLGFCYEKGDGVSEDKAEAVKWYRKAADQEDMYGQEVLGNCYRDGIGVDKDMTEAVKWYRKAAEQGEAEAQYNLGLCYSNGRGVEQDKAEAVKWYRKAAEQGNASAQYNLGVCYKRGEGVEQDKAEAVKWYRKAAEKENKDGLTGKTHKKVQLWEDGPYWAETNIGAEEPWEYGFYFWWGDVVGHKYEGGAWVSSDGTMSNFSFDSSNTPTYGKSIATLQNAGWITADGILAPEHDAAHVHWGGGWRMPTKQDLEDLVSKCDWTWTTMNGVQGYVIRGKEDYASDSIFLPVAGYCIGSLFDSASLVGDYWSSVPHPDGNAWGIFFNSSYHYTRYNYGREWGYSIRPVQGAAK